MTETTDHALLARARQGDAAATEALLVRHAPAILRYAGAVCRDANDREDVAQDVLIAAARGLRTLRDDDSLRGWLRSVTRNTCARRRRRRAGAPPVFDEVGDELPSDGTSPEQLAADAELRATLDGAIEGLDPKYRSVLVLRDVEGFTAPEVADMLGLRLDTVKTRLHRARAAVRSALDPSRLPPPGPGCPDILAKFSSFLEGDIDDVGCEALHAHVSTCPACDAACASLRRSVGLCRATRGPPPPEIARAVRSALEVVLSRPRRADVRAG